MTLLVRSSLLLGNSRYYYYCCPVLNPCATAKSHPIKFINFINTNTSRCVHDDDLDEQRRVGAWERGGRHHYHCELILFRFVALFSLNSCKDTLFTLPLSPSDDDCHPILTNHPPPPPSLLLMGNHPPIIYKWWPTRNNTLVPTPLLVGNYIIRIYRQAPCLPRRRRNPIVIKGDLPPCVYSTLPLFKRLLHSAKDCYNGGAR